MDFGLKGKVVLITGSTKGIGKAIAKAFVLNGAKTIVNGRNPVEVESVVKELNDLNGPGSALGLCGDISSAEGEINAANFIETLGEPLEVLVNNVGVFDVKDFFENTDQDWDRYFQINVMSAVRLSR